MKRIIGLYGYSGAGKSTFSGRLRELGAKICDADEIGRRILEKGSPLLHKIKELFGEEVIAEDGSLKRKVLGDIVFNSAEKLALLNSVTRPEIDRIIREEINSFSEGIMIIDCAMIKELSVCELCDELIFITAPEEALIKRLLARESISEETARGRIARQKESLDLREATVIENSKTEEELLEKADILYERLITEV